MKFLCILSLKHSRSARLKMCLFVTIALCALVRPLNVEAAGDGNVYVKSVLRGNAQTSAYVPIIFADFLPVSTTLSDAMFGYVGGSSPAYLYPDNAFVYDIEIPMYLWSYDELSGHYSGPSYRFYFRVESIFEDLRSLRFDSAYLTRMDGSYLATSAAIQYSPDAKYANGQVDFLNSVSAYSNSVSKTDDWCLLVAHLPDISFFYNGISSYSEEFILHMRFVGSARSNTWDSSLGDDVFPYIRFICTSNASGVRYFTKISDSSSLIGAVQDVTDELVNQREEDRQDATKAGQDVNAFVSSADSLKSKWEILWYPISFTNQLLSVFTGGTSSASYVDSYGYVSGFTYDEDSGYLIPVIDASRSSPRVGGASITWPSYTLPYLNVTLWDAYTFDLSTVKESFPVLFNSIYVVVSVLELYWIVGFLRSKYEEVFG